MEWNSPGHKIMKKMFQFITEITQPPACESNAVALKSEMIPSMIKTSLKKSVVVVKFDYYNRLLYRFLEEHHLAIANCRQYRAGEPLLNEWLSSAFV